jgi:hypothetical protein
MAAVASVGRAPMKDWRKECWSKATGPSSVKGIVVRRRAACRRPIRRRLSALSMRASCSGVSARTSMPVREELSRRPDMSGVEMERGVQRRREAEM